MHVWSFNNAAHLDYFLTEPGLRGEACFQLA